MGCDAKPAPRNDHSRLLPKIVDSNFPARSSSEIARQWSICVVVLVYKGFVRWRIMAIGSRIEWTEATWNPVTGCTKVSPGCKNCYAERMSKRLQAMGVPQYKDAFSLAMHPQSLMLPLGWKKPRRVFVNSMSDLFQ